MSTMKKASGTTRSSIARGMSALAGASPRPRRGSVDTKVPLGPLGVSALDRNVMLSEPAAMWFSTIGELDGQLKINVDSITDKDLQTGKLHFISNDDYSKAALAAWAVGAPKRATGKKGSYTEPLLDAEAESFALNMSSVVYYCIESSNDEGASPAVAAMESRPSLLEEDEEDDSSDELPTRGSRDRKIPEGVPPAEQKKPAAVSFAEPEPEPEPAGGSVSFAADAADVENVSSTEGRRLSRMKSYSAGEYGDAMRAEPEAEVTFAEDAAAPAAPAQGEDAPRKMVRLKSYAGGEYGDAMRDGHAMAAETEPQVTFAEDAAAPAEADGSPSRLVRLKSYAGGEYGDAMRDGDAMAAETEPQVTFAEDAAAPAEADGSPSRLVRLKSYAGGEYGDAMRAGAPADVTFAEDVTGPAGSDARDKPSSIARLKSYGADEYKAVLAAEAAYSQAVRDYLASIGETELADHVIDALQQADYEPHVWVSELQSMKAEGVLGQFLGVADQHRFSTTAASGTEIALAAAQAEALVGGAGVSLDGLGSTAEEDDEGGARLSLGGATPGAKRRPAGLQGSAPPASETFVARRALAPGQSMLHLVLVEEDWECSVTLRIFMDDDAAVRTGEFIETAVLSSTADGKERSKGKAVLSKWLLTRKELVPPDNASVVAGITTDDLRQRVAIKASKRGIGKRKRKNKRQSAASDEPAAQSPADQQKEEEEEDIVYAAMWDSVASESKFMPRDVVKQLHGMLPPFQQVNDWELLFSNAVNGNSLQTMTRLCAGKGATVVAVEDVNGNVFGGYASTSWRTDAEYDGNFYSNGQCFVWSAKPEGRQGQDPDSDNWTVTKYGWTRNADQFIRNAPDSLAMGGGGSTFALWLDKTFATGTTGPCDTFGNPPLIDGTELLEAKFSAKVVEMWGVDIL